MAPVWYYSEDSDQKRFVAYHDSKGGSTKRQFFAGDGTFLDQTASLKNVARAFKVDFENSKRLGELQGRPNLEAAAKAGKLPDHAVHELKSLLWSIHRIAVPPQQRATDLSIGELLKDLTTNQLLSVAVYTRE